MHPKNRRHRQRIKREERQQSEVHREQAQDLARRPFSTRGDVRKASELFSLGVCTNVETEKLFRRLIEFGMQTGKVRQLCSVINAQAKIIKAEQEERKIHVVEQREFIPTAPIESITAPVPVEHENPMQLAFLEEHVTEVELAETLKVFVDTGIADRMIDKLESNGDHAKTE